MVTSERTLAVVATAVGSPLSGDNSVGVPPSAPSELARGWLVVHDFCYAYGGAERVTSVLASRVLPQADVSCLAGDEALLRRMVPDRSVTTLFGGALTGPRSYRYVAPLMASTLARRAPLPVNAVASSYAFAHHLPVEGDLVVYCHSPLRQLWSEAPHHHPAQATARWALARTRHHLQSRDRRAARRATRYVATSAHVRDRVRAAYGREDVPVVPPPVERSIARARRRPEREDWLLYAGRLVEPYKRVSLLIEAVRGTGLRLVIAGDGRDRARLEASAPENVRFVGSLPTQELVDHYERAAALVMPSEEDFGMVSTEAQTCGTPVVALCRGGGRETVVNELSGLLFDRADPRALRRLLAQAVRLDWDHDAITRRAEALYSEDAFAAAMGRILGLGPAEAGAPAFAANAGAR